MHALPVPSKYWHIVTLHKNCTDYTAGNSPVGAKVTRNCVRIQLQIQQEIIDPIYPRMQCSPMNTCMHTIAKTQSCTCQGTVTLLNTQFFLQHKLRRYYY